MSGQRRVRAEIEHGATRTLLVRTARRVLAEEECEDAAHDAVVQALSARATFREDAQVGTWLYRVAFNAALMRQRKARRASHRIDRAKSAEVDAPWLGHGAGPSAAGAIEEEEERQRLRRAVARLPSTYRTVVERCVYEEQEPGLVAREMGITPSAVRTRIARARDQLRALLAGPTLSLC